MVLKEVRENANRALREEQRKQQGSAESPKIDSSQFSMSEQHYPSSTLEAKEHVSMFLQSARSMGKHIHEIPTFDSRELLLGRWLGKGGFSDVDELRGFVHIPESLRPVRKNTAMRLFERLRNQRPEDVLRDVSETSRTSSHIPGPEELGYERHEPDCSESTNALEEPSGSSAPQMRRLSSSSEEVDTEAAREFLIKNCVRETGEARYAIKRLRKGIVKDPELFPSGAMDLAVEALFLADLAHPNVIKLRGIANCDPFSSTPEDYYFLILDRLQDTLTVRMAKWKERKRKLNTLIGRITDVGGRRRQLLLDERLAAAFDLSAAMSYLKQNRILHRDIKPENLGFDIRGDIKIFDFGLARELRPMDKDPDLPGMYKLSNMTGSLRYMAPEVASVGTPYNEACDVYSFTIVLWEMLTLKRAYMNISRTQEGFMEQVHQLKVRPPMRHSWSRNLRGLLQCGWAHDHTKRWTAEQCNDILRNELVSMRHGDDEGLDHVRRRSTYVMEDESNRRGGGAFMKSASANNGEIRRASIRPEPLMRGESTQF